ncbi:iridoid oxidase-like [Impatiens glandulifera]|uniref:iridoid oxidase-like n=1 Tax=Impatiens glandulifera TaxID=253017 RepID=UPI001FB08304|nr:iridoid oxidase-like [Impatiens glandulifera]
MDWIWSCSISMLSLILSGPLLIIILFLYHARRRQAEAHDSGKLRPPGPPGWPVVGNIFDLGELPHQTLCKLRDKFGPVIWLQLGSVGTVAVNSADAAAKLFKNHDLVFSDRKCPDALTAHGFNHGSMAIGNYGSYWRVVKRIGVTEFNTAKRVNETVHVRRKCVDNMILWIEEAAMESYSSGRKGEIEIAHFLFLMAFNVVGNMIFSEDILESKNIKGKEFFDSMSKIMVWTAKPNLSDYFPMLKRLDLLGIKKGMMKDMGTCLKMVENFVKERVVQEERFKSREDYNRKKDFLDVLMEFQGDNKEGISKVSEENLNILMTEMFFAGSETTSNSIEWLMSELLNHPNCMMKLKDELDRIVGRGRKIEESDIDELSYLQACVKEALRLHPPLPMLLPRNSMEDTNYNGYFIPKGTQVLVNAYAIGRDPEVWDDPLDFKPERFLDKNIELVGQHFGLIPFGAGRRICMGYALGQRVLHLVTATLIHTFDWKVGDSTTPGMIDMNEKMGITVRKLNPLIIIPTKREL